MELSHNIYVLRSLQKCQGSGIAEQPLRRVDMSFKVWACTELNSHMSAASLADEGQRCEM